MLLGRLLALGGLWLALAAIDSGYIAIYTIYMTMHMYSPTEGTREAATGAWQAGPAGTGSLLSHILFVKLFN